MTLEWIENSNGDLPWHKEGHTKFLLAQLTRRDFTVLTWNPIDGWQDTDGRKVFNKSILRWARIPLDKEPCPFCVRRVGRICTTCEDCCGSGEVTAHKKP